ncbi:kinase-like domain-containing protein [Xylaria venustula]|nr:kinase-like domain-containing protein [Xylaria venustula]
MAASIEAETIFEVHSNADFINDPHNKIFLVSDAKAKLGTDIVDGQPVRPNPETEEGATPAPERIPLPNFLRITTNHAAKFKPLGFVFGSERHSCDILIAPDQTGGVSRKQFGFVFTMPGGRPTLIFESLSRWGTNVSSTQWPSQKIESQRAISVDDRELDIDIGTLNIRIKFPDHSQHDVQWEQNWLAYCLEYAVSESERPRNKSQGIRSETTITKIPWKDRYSVQNVLGKGTFGVVRCAQDRFTGQLVAVKEFHQSVKAEERRETSSEFLTGLSHHSIVKYLEVRDDPPTVIMELLDGATLKEVHEYSAITNIELRQTVWLLADALHYLHSNNITHRDLKPANIMVVARNPMRVKIVDFGLAINKREMIETLRTGTPKYWAPELAGIETDSKPYTDKVDIWSLGVITMELSSGTPAAQQHGWHNILIRRAAEDYRGREQPYMPEAFVYSSLQLRPGNRPTAAECREMEFPLSPFRVATLRPAGQVCVMTSISSGSTTNLNTESSCQGTKRSHSDADSDNQSTPNESATVRARGKPAGHSTKIPSSPMENRSGRSNPEDRSSQESSSSYQNHERGYVSPEHLTGADLANCPTPRAVSHLSSPCSPRSTVSENDTEYKPAADPTMNEYMEAWRREKGPDAPFCPTPGGSFYQRMRPSTYQNMLGEGSSE